MDEEKTIEAFKHLKGPLDALFSQLLDEATKDPDVRILLSGYVVRQDGTKFEMAVNLTSGFDNLLKVSE